MLVTTSRDPSARARRLGRALASFLSIPYMNRGKQNQSEDETWLVVAEDHGNPGALIKRSAAGTEQLAFRLSMEPAAGRMKRAVPVVVGEERVACKIARFFDLCWIGSLAQAQRRALVVASGRIDFVDEGEAKFRLLI